VRTHATPEQRDGIFLHVQQRAVVVGPCHVGLDILDHIAQQLAGGDVLAADAELATSDRILRIGEQRVIRAGLVAAELKKRLPDGERIAIQQHDFARLRRVRPTHDQRVLPAAHEAGRIPVTPIAHRHAGIVLLDAGDDLPVQLIDQRLRGRQYCLCVSRLGPQMRKDLRVGAGVVAQPVEGVLPDTVRRRHTVHEGGRSRGVRYGRLGHEPYIARAGPNGKSAPPARRGGRVSAFDS
jgi:hypothetical protein